MKRKFLSIIFCLMICLSSMIVLSACGEEKPVEIGEVEATQELHSAVEKLSAEKVVKIHSDNFMFLGEITIIASENIIYETFFDSPTWSKKEGDYWYSYATVFSTINGTSTTSYIKKLIPQEQEDFQNESLDILEEFMGGTFSSASRLNGELTIIYSMVEDGETINVFYKIENGTLKSIKVGSGINSMSIDFEFGAHIIDEIPEIPTNVDWIEYESCIEVEGIPEEFEIDENLNLENVVLYFYEDIDDFFPEEEFNVTMDMISGFDTTTATEEGQPRTMTITFCGLTYTIRYTVTAQTTT